MDDHINTITMMFLGFLFLIILGISHREQYDQDHAVMAITETIRSSAISNANHRSRLSPGEFYIQKESFEDTFERLVYENRVMRLSEGAEITFDYLEDEETGSTKAIRVIINESDNKVYQATAVVDIASGGWNVDGVD